jgi:hypothetical protein
VSVYTCVSVSNLLACPTTYLGTGEHRRDIIYRIHASRLKAAFTHSDDPLVSNDSDLNALGSLSFSGMPEASSNGTNGSTSASASSSQNSDDKKGWLRQVMELIECVEAEASKTSKSEKKNTLDGKKGSKKAKVAVEKKKVQTVSDRFSIITDAMRAMVYFVMTNALDHRAVHRLAKAVVRVGQLGLGLEGSHAGLAAMIMHTLFDKKRAQIVAVWMPDSAVDFGLFAQRIYKFDGYRLKYTAMYTDLLCATGQFKRLLKLWETFKACKERDNYALQLCSRLCLDAMVQHLESALAHRSRLAFRGDTNAIDGAGTFMHFLL